MQFFPHAVTLRQLQYIGAVAEHRSFREAAQACRVAQPSLSAQVAQAEAAIGFSLFERKPRQSHVTVSGSSYQELARGSAPAQRHGASAGEHSVPPESKLERRRPSKR